LNPIFEEGAGFFLGSARMSIGGYTMNETDKYYQILGLDPGASERELFQAYKILIRALQPDRFGKGETNQKIAEEKIKEIDEAFKTLLLLQNKQAEESLEQKTRVKPEPSDKGGIVVQTEPTGATVYFNEKLVGTSPFKIKELPIRSYKVKILKEGYEVWEQDVFVKAGEIEEISAQLDLKGPTPGRIWKDPHLGMEFVFAKGGEFKMGDVFNDGNRDEKPVHEVRLDGFWIGKYLVTQGQWEAVMGGNPSQFKSGNHYPVEQVRWYDVEEFVKRLNEKTKMNFRLPTEAEWEYAARSGGREEKWAGTSLESEIDEYAWFEFNSANKTHPVGEKKPNALGLHDMSGNVWEWVHDWYDKDYYHNSPMDNPRRLGQGEYKVIRGGNWESETLNLRTTGRWYSYPLQAHYGVGFRLVFPVQQEQPIKTEKDKPSVSGDKPYGISTPSIHETSYKLSSEPSSRKDLKHGIDQTVSASVVEYAGFWKRFAALIIDSMIISIVTYIVYLMIPVMLSRGRPESEVFSGWIVWMIVNWLYGAVMESSSGQATLGKMALGIIVTDYEGERISFGRATGRLLGKIISSLILLIGYLMAGFTEKKQALHDMIAGTLVVVKK
jgi:formylglycine-generating enzyme required for sulfatase activity/uncharacterized RDD family membrane protein YckC